MQVISEEFKIAISKPSREIKSRITLPGLTLDDDNIQTIDLDSSLVFGEDFEIGTAPMDTLKIKLIFSPEGYVEYDYEDKECDAQLGLVLDKTLEYLSIGLFTIEDVVKNDYNITLNCVDRMYKAEKEFVNNLMFPTTILEILKSACEQSGIELATMIFANSDYIVPNEPVFDNMTCRTIFAQVAELAGGYAKINRQGKLEITTLGTVSVRDITKDHYIDFKRDEVAIGKIDRVIVKVGEEAAEQGIGDNIYTIVDNMFVQDPNNVVGPLFNVLKDVNYNACEVRWQGDFSLDLCDKVTVDGYETYVLNKKLNYTGGLREDYRAPAKSNVERNSTGKSNILLDINNVKTQIKVIEGEITHTIESIEGEVKNEVAEQMKTAEIYTWIKYANDEYGNGISDNPAGKKYVGIATNKKNVEPSNTPDDYEWSLIKGDKGAQGEPGKDGIPGEPGEDGEDGQTTYTWIMYANDVLGNGISDDSEDKRYVGIATNKLTPNKSVNPDDYEWSPLYDNVEIGGANRLYDSRTNIEFAYGDWGRNYFYNSLGDTSARKAIQLEPNTEYIMSTDLPRRYDGGTHVFVGLPGFVASSTSNGVYKGEHRRVTTDATGMLEFQFSHWDTNWLSGGEYHIKLEKTTPWLEEQINLEGRNLIPNSNFSKDVLDGWESPYGTHQIKNSFYIATLTRAQAPSRAEYYTDTLEPGIYTFSMMAKSEKGFRYNMLEGTEYELKNIEGSQGFKISYITFEVTEPQQVYIRMYFNNPEVGDTMEIDWVKLEKGSTATPWNLALEEVLPWTPAPEDVNGWLDIKLIRGPGNPYYKAVSPHADFTSLSVGFPSSRFAEPLESLGRVTVSLDVMVEVDREITINNSTFAVPGNRWTRIFFTKEFTENNNISTRVLTPYSRKRKVIRNISTNLIDELRTDINTLYYRNLQVEQGNVPTSYNLTPEELEGEITRSKTEIKQLKDSILLVATRNENTGRFEITPESIVQAIDSTDGVGRLKTVKVTVDENGLTVDDGALIIRDRNNTAIVTSDGLRVVYLFTSSGEFSGWQQVGILNRYTDLTRRMATINIYIPADLIIDKAELHTKSMPSYWTGHTGVPNGFYHARNLKLYEGDASDGVLDWPYSSSYDVTFGRSGRTDITSNTWGGNWTPTGEGIKTKTADVKDYIYPGQRTVFIVDTADSVSEANSRYMGAMQMDLVITGFLRG